MRRYRTDSGIYADQYDDAFLEIDDETEYYDEYAEETMDDGSWPSIRRSIARTHDWRKVAYYYNGSGQVEVYSGRLQNAYQHAQQLVTGNNHWKYN